LCLLHTIHGNKTQFYQQEQRVELIIHWPNKHLASAIKKHSINSISSNQCLLRNWDKLNNCHVVLATVCKTTVQDKLTDMIISHSQLLQTIPHLLNNVQTIHFNKKVLTHPQLIIQNDIVANNHLKMIRVHSRKKEVIEYLINKNQWTLQTVHSLAWDAHGKAIQQLPSRQKKKLIQFLHNVLPINMSHSLQLQHYVLK
jgi:hypothetical protein